MSALRELQQDFAAAILRGHGEADSPEQLVPGMGPPGVNLARRFAVYRVNARENLAMALEAAYPVLHRETGPQEFRSLAWSYQLAHPSPSGNLYETGRQLPLFLASALAGTGREYLADLARLEWAVQEAMVAADDHHRFDPGVLAGIPAGQHGELRFTAHPSARVLRLDHEVFSFWQAFHADSARIQGGRAARQYVLARRAGDGIELQRLDAVEYHCLESLLGGGTLENILDAALAHDAAVDIGALLVRWARQAIITGLDHGQGDPS